MKKIQMLSGLGSFDIPELSESTKIALAKRDSNIQRETTAPQQTLKLWNDYTADELWELKTNQRAIYISLYMIEYGFAPKYL